MKYNYLKLHFIHSDPGELFDIDLVTKALRDEKVQDLCCIKIPEELNYANYMLIGTCFSEKHLHATFFAINKRFKKLKDKETSYMSRKLGKENKWCAMDTGNLVIHLFLDEYREFYDLESLWSCGVEFDEKYHEFNKHQIELQERLLVKEEEI